MRALIQSRWDNEARDSHWQDCMAAGRPYFFGRPYRARQVHRKAKMEFLLDMYPSAGRLSKQKRERIRAVLGAMLPQTRNYSVGTGVVYFVTKPRMILPLVVEWLLDYVGVAGTAALAGEIRPGPRPVARTGNAFMPGDPERSATVPGTPAQA